MKIKCPACSKVLSIPDSAAGKIVKCPCGKQLRAPGAASPSASAPAASRPAGPNPATARPAAARPAAGAGDFDPEMFDDLTDEDLKPVKGVTNPYTPVSSPSLGSSKLLNQYAPRGGTAGQGRREIAGVGSRILGAIVDALFVYLFIGMIAAAFFLILPGEGAKPTPVQLSLVIGIAFIGALAPTVINCILIAKSGQSVGKKAVGTRIIDQETNAQAGVVQGYIVRTVAFGFLLGIPVVGIFVLLVDIVFLFGENHQTLHDKMAKTLVVRA